jgi:hypothetical protein
MLSTVRLTAFAAGSGAAVRAEAFAALTSTARIHLFRCS